MIIRIVFTAEPYCKLSLQLNLQYCFNIVINVFTRTNIRKPGIEATVIAILPGFNVLLSTSLSFNRLT